MLWDAQSLTDNPDIVCRGISQPNRTETVQQMLGLARPMALDPEFLIVDEPFSALNPFIRRSMQDESLQLQDRIQKTMVFISHEFLEAKKPMAA